MCLACREMKPKDQLIRIAKSPENEISIDLTGKKPGRGAYICRNKDCFDRAIKKNALSRAFKAQISIDILEVLREQCCD